MPKTSPSPDQEAGLSRRKSDQKRSRSSKTLRSQLERLEAELGEAQLLIKVSRKTAVCRSVQESLHTFLEIIVEELGTERGALFLNDPITGELFSKVLVGRHTREIRVLNT